MQNEISITVTNRLAHISGTPVIICGNSDYTVLFDFDAEWDGTENLNAHIRYLRNGLPEHDALPITDGACNLPAIYGTDAVQIGVSGGSIRTSVPAEIPCIPCANDFGGTEKQPVRDVYNEIMEVIADAGY